MVESGEQGERGQTKSMAQFRLKPHASIPKPSGPVMVCILDGFGYNKEDQYNGVFVADTPVYDSLRKNEERFRTVRAHGTAVGLPSDADMGNSEVGHNALGSGQVVDQGARLVDIALEDGSAFTGEGFQYIKPALAEHTLHFIGLLSDGGVHSRYDQLAQFIKGSVKEGARRIRVHVLTDGRDVPDGTSVQFVQQLEADLKEVCAQGVDAKIASGGGRMGVTMDRYEADWNIVKKGWYAHVLGEAPHTFTYALDAVKTLRKGGEDGKPVSDQWLPPFVIVDDDKKPVGTVEDGDAVVLFNFRADRMVEISKAFEYEEFSAFDRKRWPRTLFAGMMQYDGDLRLPTNFLVPPPAIDHVSGQYLAGAGLKTFACSETQKFGHVTFFWNGNRSGFFDEDLETFVEIPSDNVPFNELPDMKAAEITAAGQEALLSKKFDMVRINYANPDMVGHTGDLDAVVRAVTTVDKCLGELLETVEKLGGRWLVASDHGNADDMVQRHKKTGEALSDENGQPLPLTSHTLAPVPVAIGGSGLPDNVIFRKDLPDAGLANITGTYINLLGYEAPDCWVPSLLGFK